MPDTPDWILLNPGADLSAALKNHHVYQIVTINGKVTTALNHDGNMWPISNWRDSVTPVAALEVQLPDKVINHIIDLRNHAGSFKPMLRCQPMAQNWDAITRQYSGPNIPKEGGY